MQVMVRLVAEASARAISGLAVAQVADPMGAMLRPRCHDSLSGQRLTEIVGDLVTLEPLGGRDEEPAFTAFAMQQKSRLIFPSPLTTAGSPARIRSVPFRNRAAYAPSATWRGPKTLRLLRLTKANS
jgi:hypothetical protein